ncbi:hypothetical protein CPB83DRAFT_424604 [Crepidotus variabilis]|uniref:Uncharacterized protein n=1 Tax=Crepidotus variabilis TaxID=179855 RepID=A0A9P6EE93_9AGAR|nr:hypothetical protein CPB83DRAFT_424604 [Crepidotus variabilis]
MFLSRFRALRRPTTTLRNARSYAVASPLKAGVSAKFDAFRSLEEENARLLRVVEKRVGERLKLKSEVRILHEIVRMLGLKRSLLDIR